MGKSEKSKAPAKINAAGSFRTTLRRAIKSEFKTQTAFGDAMGVSKGYVSQIITGRAKVDNSKLDEIVVTFTNGKLQSDVHEAWRQEFARPPSIVYVGQHEADMLVSSRELQASSPVRALQAAEQARRTPSDSEVWLSATEIIVQLHLKMGQTAQALREATALERRAREERCLDHLYKAVVLKGASLRHQERPALRGLVDTYYEARNILAERPTKARSSEALQNQRAELERELAKHLLTVACSKGMSGSSQELLREARSHIDESISRAANNSAKLHSMEILSRIELASGDDFNARETIEAMDKLARGGSYDVYPKLLTEARIAAKIGRPDQAETMLVSLIDSTLETLSLHFHRVANQALAQLQQV